MIELVSNDPAKGKIGVLDRISQEQLCSPGAYARNDASASSTYQYRQREESNGGGFLGFLGRFIIKAAIIGSAAILARKYIPSLKRINTIEELAEDAKFTEKFKYKFAKCADWLERNTIGLFKKIK